MDMGAVSITEEQYQGFARSIRSSIRVRDCVALGTIPALLIGLYFLPDAVKLAYTFDYSNPRITTAFTAHFVHLRAEHLLTNVVGFVLLAGTGYLLAVLTEQRRLFGIAATTYLVAFPPIISALNLAVPRDAITYGFSGIVMAFAGLLPLLLSIYAHRRLGLPIGLRRAPGVFFATLSVIALTAMPRTRTTVGIAVIASVVALAYFVSGGEFWRNEPRLRRLLGHSSGWMELFLVGAGLTFAYPIIGFPTPVTPGTVVPNLYTHLLGYCLAFMVPYIVLSSGIHDGSDPVNPTER